MCRADLHEEFHIFYRYECQINIFGKTIDRSWITFAERSSSLKHTNKMENYIFSVLASTIK